MQFLKCEFDKNGLKGFREQYLYLQNMVEGVSTVQTRIENVFSTRVIVCDTP